jgi:4-amino-4-deoxychorismate lyase
MLAYVNEEFLDMRSAQIPAFQSGFYYGTGCFETIRADAGSILFFNDHYNRLKAGLRYIGVDESEVPEQNILLDASKNLLKKNELMESIAKVRIQCSLAEQNGYAPDKSSRLNTIISVEKYKLRKNPGTLMLAETRVIPGSCRPSELKLCNMLHYRNAYREAQKSGADDAVMLTINGFLSETSIANLFWKSGDSIFTPSFACDLLPGITRKYMIESLRLNSDFTLTEGEFEVDHLLTADSVWVTNSLVEIQPVKRIDTREYRVDDHLNSTLMNMYRSLKEAY